jgi:hypothetical protein
MKEFKVPIKNELRDYTSIRDFWVSLNDHIEFFDYASSSAKNEALLCFFSKNVSGLPESSALSSGDFAKAAKSADGDVFFVDSDKGKLSAAIASGHTWLLVKRDSKKLVILKNEPSNYEIDLHDFIVCLKGGITAEAAEKLARDLYGSPLICYSLLNAIQTFLESKNLDAMPLAVLDYSPKESYHFSIKSSLNSVSLTIDMIKNKVLKYHYDKIWKIETVLHESLVNAITYGNELDYDRPVNISYEVGDKGFKIIIRDTGTGFDVSGFSVPVGLEALDQISGRGKLL